MESAREDGIEAVVTVTPNNWHIPYSKRVFEKRNSCNL